MKFMVCFNLAWINIAWDHNNSPFYRSLRLEMDRVHISISSVIFFSLLNSWQKRENMERIKFYFSSFSDRMTSSLWVGTILHSWQIWKTPKILVWVRNLANKNLRCHGLICSGELTKNWAWEAKERISPGSMERYWNGYLFKKVSNFISSLDCHRYYFEPNLICYFPDLIEFYIPGE